MDEKTLDDVEETKTEEVADNTTETPAGNVEEKIFTQKDVDVLFSQRMERERKKILAEVDAKYAEDIKKIEVLTAENEALKNEAKRQALINTVKGLGVDDDFIDYVIHSAKDGNVQEFVENNPKVLKENFIKTDSNLEYVGDGKRRLGDAKTDAEYLEIRRELEAKKRL